MREAYSDLDGERRPRATSAGCGCTAAPSSALPSDLLPPPPDGRRRRRPRPARARHRLPARQPRARPGGARLHGRAAGGGRAGGDAHAARPTRRSTSAARAAPPRPQQRAFAEVDAARRREPDGQPAVRQRRPGRPSSSRQLGEEALRERYTIGQWAWETDVVPALVGRVRSSSSTRSGSTRRYVAENLARATDVDVPVVVMPLPVDGARRRAARRCRSSCRTASCSCSRSTSSPRSSARTRSG